MKKVILGLFFAIALAFTQNSNAYHGTEGKACPDFDSDNCCEQGSGNCLETVVIIKKK